MADKEAVVALSVRPFDLPGDNPETDLAHVDVTAVVTGGQVYWQQDVAKPVPLDAGQQISMLDDGLPRIATAEEMPEWEKTNDISEIDRLASATLEPMLDEDRPMEIVLAEKVDHPRVEVRSLAARSLATIGKFDALIDSFNDDTLKSYWSDHFDQLHAAIARGPQTATQVREAIERRKGEDAGRIYRLLQGYSPAQLAARMKTKIVASNHQQQIALGRVLLEVRAYRRQIVVDAINDRDSALLYDRR